MDRLGGLRLAIVGVGTGAGLVAGGGDAGGGGGGCGAGDGVGCGAGGGAGRGLVWGLGRERRLAGDVAAPGATAVLGAGGPSVTGANGLVAGRTRPRASVVRAAAGENGDTTARCCAAGRPTPADDDWLTSSACCQRCTESAAPSAATTAQRDATMTGFTLSVLRLSAKVKAHVACGSTLTTRFFPCRFAS